MKSRKGCLWIVFLACCTTVGLSISVNPAQHGQLVDESGKPIPDAFVFHHYSAGAKLIWPWAYHEGPFLMRSDREGKVFIPPKVRLRFPFVGLTSPVRSFVSVYAPRLHNSCEIFDPEAVDSHYAKHILRHGENVFKIIDLSNRPAERFHTLWVLAYATHLQAQGPVEQRLSLMIAARQEYDQFIKKFGDAIFENSPGEWGHIQVRDWTAESGEHRPWSFFLQRVPFYSTTMEEKFGQWEKQIGTAP